MPPITTADTNAEQASSPTASGSSSILKERRFKLSRACDRCRRRRIKCDEGHPCQACLTVNSACTFEEPGKRTHPHKSKRTATLEDRMHHLETLISAIPPAVFAAGVSPGYSNATEATSPLVPFKHPDGLPLGVPPPSLHVFPLTNPSTHFTLDHPKVDVQQTPSHSMAAFGMHPLRRAQMHGHDVDSRDDEPARLSLTASYLYFDDEGYTRWQGETSGLPVLDLLVERHGTVKASQQDPPRQDAQPATSATEWFPNRQLRRTDVNPQTLWRLITSSISPELMDSLVQCYLSTSYYILPFLHVPTFLADYGNPQKWGEPGFAAFIVSICCLASRHMDDPRVRADPNDGISAGVHWFELFGRLRTLPIADRPTLYSIQANLIAAVYAVGLGKTTKAAALLAEAVTMSIDAGLHRSADTYDLFDPIEDEVRKRTFWCVYIWDKQLCAHFGRPPVLRLKDCDVAEPSPVDDEYITKDGVGTPPPGSESRLGAFIVSLRIMVVLESVLDVSPSRQSDDASSFLRRATNLLSGATRFNQMREEEALLDDIHRNVPPFWSHCAETLASDDTIRLTQAERLYCVEHFVRLLIHRHRFSELVAERTNGPVAEEQTEAEKEALVAAHHSALQIISTHVSIAKKGLMTYYGVHVIHQLTQAGRTLVAVLLCCKPDAMQHLIPTGLDALRSCIGLLRRFSGRYVCGLRSGDLMEEFCRLTGIPLETNRPDAPSGPSASGPAWIRPVRKKAPSIARSTQSGDSPNHSSPEAFSPSDFFAEPIKASFSSSSASGSNSSPRFNGGAPGSVSMGMDVGGMMRDEHMYLPGGDVMAFFGEGSMDVAQMFAGESFGQSGLHLAGAPGAAASGDIAAGGFTGPGGFLKMNGLASSP